mmetsp:Transcript_1027/g.1787  ORF Transcript_1027/g.1787 Transcript_1027/m.1787 type:complete len:456 (-) Transcript_1027:502-1869(-)
MRTVPNVRGAAGFAAAPSLDGRVRLPRTTSLEAVSVNLPQSPLSLPEPVTFSNPLLLPPPVPFGYLPLKLLHRFLLLSLSSFVGFVPHYNQRVTVKALVYIFLRFLATFYVTRMLIQELLLRPTQVAHPYKPTQISAFSKNVSADLHYLLQRPSVPSPSSPIVHLSHGFGASSLSFIGVVPSLSFRLGGTVVASDAMGFGFSRYPSSSPLSSVSDYSIDRSSELAFANLENVVGKNNENPHLFVGHSMGAVQAMRMARKKKLEDMKCPVKVVLVSPAIAERQGRKVKGGDKITNGLIRYICLPFVPLLSLFLRRLVSTGKFWRNGLAMAWGDGKKLTQDSVNLYRYPSIATGWERGLLKFTAAQITGLGSFVGERGRKGDGELLLSVCKVCDEVVIVHGRKDRIVPLKNSLKLKDWVEEEGGKLEVVELSGVGHVAHEELEDDFVSICGEIITKI